MFFNETSPLAETLRSRIRIAASTACIALLIGVSQTAILAQSAVTNSWSQPELPAAHQASLLEPFWIGNRMSNEPIFFIQAPNEALSTARLLFVPSKILTISSVDGATTYVEGKDYTWKRGTNLLTLTSGSRIPFKTWAEMHPPIGAPHTLDKTKDGTRSLFFLEKTSFQDLQALVTYDHKTKWQGHIPQSGAVELARTIAKLQAKQPVNIVVLGDSISVGGGASSLFHIFPYQPNYPELIADGLRFRYGAPISLTNLSEGGQDSKWGVTQASKVVAAKPDLVLIAFGMNDCSRLVPAEVYGQHIQSIVATIHDALPETDIILVSTMVGNPDWDEYVPDLYSGYLAALTRAKQPGIAVADLTTVWRDMLNVKKFADITSNGINHPNDFGQRTYAQVILQLMQ